MNSQPRQVTLPLRAVIVSQAVLLTLVGVNSVAHAVDIFTVDDPGGTTRFGIEDTGATRVVASAGTPALTVTQAGAGEAARLVGGTVRVGDGSAAAGVVIDDLTAGVSPTVTQAAAGAVFGGGASNADAFHTHAALAGGGVKSIQRGNASLPTSGSTVLVTLPLAVDWTKSIILLNGGVVLGYSGTNANGAISVSPYVVSTPTGTTFNLRIPPKNIQFFSQIVSNAGVVTWQVIEYE